MPRKLSVEEKKATSKNSSKKPDAKKVKADDAIPSPKNAEKEMRVLEKEIRHHQYLYYVRNKPIISDFEFDKKFKRLQSLEQTYPKLMDPASPTLTVGSDLDKDFQKFTHKLPVLSLENTYSEEDLLDWIQKRIRTVFTPWSGK